MAEAGSFGYPTRADLDGVLDELIRVKAEAKAETTSLMNKLEWLLLDMHTEDGFYTFPDGDTFPAGLSTESEIPVNVG